MNWKKTATATAMALAVVAGAAALAQPFVQSAQAHQGMMGGWGGGGYQMGPGMMGGFGMGPGTMHGYGGGHMGPGMMGGYGNFGMGRGMAGGYALGPIYRLDLTDDQRKQIDAIEDGLRKKNWDLMGKMHDEMSNLNEVGSASAKGDRSAILAANKRMFELRQQMLENGLDAQGKVEGLLTPQQKEQLRKLSRSGPDYGTN